MAMPQLVGAPAYGRPPRPIEVVPRPFDPDDLPIEAMRGPEDEAYIDYVLHGSATTEEPPPAPAGHGGLLAIANRLFRSDA